MSDYIAVRTGHIVVRTVAFDRVVDACLRLSGVAADAVFRGIRSRSVGLPVRRAVHDVADAIKCGVK